MIVATITDRHNRVNYHLAEMFGHGSTPSPAETILSLAGMIGQIVAGEMPEGVDKDEAWAYWKERVCKAMELSAKGALNLEELLES